MEMEDPVHTVRAQRDLYRELLDLAVVDDPASFLAGAASLLLRSSGAQGVFIGVLRDLQIAWSTHEGLGDGAVEQVVRNLSQGVLRHAIDTRATVRTSSALLDARFASRDSVRRNSIEAVLCVPVEVDAGSMAVVYLQRLAGDGTFSDATVDLVERIVARIAGLGRSLWRDADDPTAAARSALDPCPIVGSSASLAAVLEQIVALRGLEVDVLLTGPTGTGKSAFAKLLHDNSPRAGRPFVAVNCPGVTPSLFEAEFFGTAAGAFTGAAGDRAGLVQSAEGGTLFLDEIAELAPDAQAKLLQLVQERVYRRVGDARERRANVRIVAATNVDLDEAVRAGRFRADLRYRLEVMPLRLPPLTERRSDIPALVQHFLQVTRTRHPTLSGLRLSPRAQWAAQHAEWPGNVRQLANAVEAGMVRAYGRRSPVVEAVDLLPQHGDGGVLTWQEATRGFQRDLLRSTLDAAEGNIAETARRLDLARSHVYELVRALEIDR